MPRHHPHFDDDMHYRALGLLNSKLVEVIAPVLNPTLSFQIEGFYKIPFYSAIASSERITEIVKECIYVSKVDWDSYENSWDYSINTIISNSRLNLESSYQDFVSSKNKNIKKLRSLEEESNQIIIAEYGLQGVFTPDVSESQITLVRADREKDAQRLLSHVIGCMMGRYSLDAPGLIYANAGNVDFDPSRYAKFPADADGIVPLTDELWFEDDAASRTREFLLAVWGEGTLAENMAWMSESLGTKDSETPDETVRRYLADKFYKDHLQTYKKRPIYWLFSSGKQGAFQALVYLHRYHEGTLARLRAEYVVPLTGKIQSRIDILQKDADAASSTAARNKLAKEVEKLKKKHVELLAYDEQLRHYADMRITLDLDDGVKVNYGKFGDLLAEVKAVIGGAGDD